VLKDSQKPTTEGTQNKLHTNQQACVMKITITKRKA
jgi:hypothetical protein